jgi:Ni/Co efflux regulator RcnB
MRHFLVVTLALGMAGSLPVAVCAQQHPESGHPSGGHPAPAMHAPAPAMHGPSEARAPSEMHAPASHFHETTHQTVSHHVVNRTVTHRVVHRAVTRGVRHMTRAAVRHLSPRVAALRRNVVAAHRFHAGIYRAPPGYFYRRWSFGEMLPAVYWGRDYWLTDFLAFGLFAPPDGYVWVRYGPDALMIDEYTGAIIQVDYGVFF